MKTASEIRERLDHPVVDVDAHMLELEPMLEDYLRQEGGSEFVERARKRAQAPFVWYRLTPEEKREIRALRPPWGLQTTNARDIATSMCPRLLYERLDELGIDFTILYPTLGMLYARSAEPELRGVACRAVNRFYAETTRELSDRMTPAAIVPMHTPEEAIREAEFAVRELGLKVIVVESAVRRPIPAFAKAYPNAPPELASKMVWLDTYGIDSEYDYDPFWAKCVELKVAVTAHLAGHWGTRTSISNYSHNHIGLFASAGEAMCKSLFMAGVTHRFPNLNFAFLEGGAGWAASLFSDLIEHWEKRNADAVKSYDPKRLDQRALLDLIARYGGTELQGPLETIMPTMFALAGWVDMDPALRDEWAPSGIERKEDIRDRFVPSFYFGCEAEDPSVVWALDAKTNPMGARLKVIFGSDIGHWDVPDVARVLPEAYEAVEKGLLTPEDFEAFVFKNPVELHEKMNPDFFRNTILEEAVQRI